MAEWEHAPEVVNGVTFTHAFDESGEQYRAVDKRGWIWTISRLTGANVWTAEAQMGANGKRVALTGFSHTPDGFTQKGQLADVQTRNGPMALLTAASKLIIMGVWPEPVFMIYHPRRQRSRERVYA